MAFHPPVNGSAQSNLRSRVQSTSGKLVGKLSREASAPVVLHARVVAGAGGGPDKTILNSPRFLAPAGYRGLCAYLRPPRDPGFAAIRQRAQQAQAHLIEIPDRGPWDWRVFTEMLNLCRRERVAIYHGHDYKTNALGLLLARFWPMHLVTTVHGWVHHTARTPLYYAVDRFCLPRYERVLCVSQDLCEQTLKAGVKPSRCVLIENGIDTQEYQRRLSRAEARRDWNVPAGRLVIGAVGRLSPEKGFDLLIRAVHQLLTRGFDLELWIAGAGAEHQALQQLITELGRGERIRLLGYSENTGDLYQAMDCLALSSHREGLPNVLLEAMAMEVPVVATRIAGIPHLVEDGVNGLLVSPGAEVELVEALAKLVADPEMRRSFARAGRHTIESRYSFANRMEKVHRIYDELWRDPKGTGTQRDNLALAPPSPWLRLLRSFLAPQASLARAALGSTTDATDDLHLFELRSAPLGLRVTRLGWMAPGKPSEEGVVHASLRFSPDSSSSASG